MSNDLVSMNNILLQDRRGFLKQISAAAAFGIVAQFPGSHLLAAAPLDLLPDPDESLLKELAFRAVEAARAAGASFADVRVTYGRYTRVECYLNTHSSPNPEMRRPLMILKYGYGIRALVGGAWGIASGSDFSPDGIAQVAAAAVARAKFNRPRHRNRLELAPEPVVRDGRWETPIAEDPFLVPIGTQADVGLEALGRLSHMPATTGWVTFTWQRTNRVFASSEGSLQVQQVNLAFPSGTVRAQSSFGSELARAEVEAFRDGGYGYEVVSSLDLNEEMLKATEMARERSAAGVTRVPTEVGRYDLVLSARAVASILSDTLTEAVNAERAFGYLANRSGTSFAAPPVGSIGQLELASNLLTVRANRTEKHGAATVGWDDEGVATREFTYIQDGVLADYLTNRQTAAELGDAYRARGEEVRSNGCASGAGHTPPSIQLPNLTMVPGGEDVSAEEMVSDIKRGFYLEYAGGSTDQQVLSGQYRAGSVREINNGKLGHTATDLAFQFLTPSFWKSMDAIGGPASSELTQVSNGLGRSSGTDGIQILRASVHAVPARFRDVNVLNIGRPLS
jgi:TldD protein